MNPFFNGQTRETQMNFTFFFFFF